MRIIVSLFVCALIACAAYYHTPHTVTCAQFDHESELLNGVPFCKGN